MSFVIKPSKICDDAVSDWDSKADTVSCLQLQVISFNHVIVPYL